MSTKAGCFSYLSRLVIILSRVIPPFTDASLRHLFIHYEINVFKTCSVVKELLPANCTTGDVRLVDGLTPAKGRVEICISRVWASLCSYRFHIEEANVVCGQLGYLRIGVFCVNA